MTSRMTKQEFLKDQAFDIALNLACIILIVLNFTEVDIKYKLIVGSLILLACLLVVKFFNKLLLKLDILKNEIDEKSKKRYLLFIKWSYRILMIIIIWTR